MEDHEISQYDRQWLHDFFSLGAWAHQYTSAALYQAAQRVPSDPAIAVDDRPRIQAVLRAKILGEVAASIETLGRFCWSVQNRQPDGIAATFINMRRDQAVEFFAAMLRPVVTGETLLETLHLPDQSTLASLSLNDDPIVFVDQLATRLGRYAAIYVDPNASNPSQAAATLGNTSLLRQSYNAIKHGSHLIANPPLLLAPSPITVDQHSIYIAVHWPERNETISPSTTRLVTRSLKEAEVKDDLDVIRTIAILLTNLCQLLIQLIDRDLLPKEYSQPS